MNSGRSDLGKPREEGSAEMRVMARAVRDVFVSLLAEGFTEKQALALVAEILAASQGAK